MSREKLIEKGREVRRWRIHGRPNDTLSDLAEAINPIVRGWMTYWVRFCREEMIPLLNRINTYLIGWARKKYERLRAFKRLKAWWVRVTQLDPTCSRTGPGLTVSSRLAVLLRINAHLMRWARDKCKRLWSMQKAKVAFCV